MLRERPKRSRCRWCVPEEFSPPVEFVAGAAATVSSHRGIRNGVLERHSNSRVDDRNTGEPACRFGPGASSCPSHPWRLSATAPPLISASTPLGANNSSSIHHGRHGIQPVLLKERWHPPDTASSRLRKWKHAGTATPGGILQRIRGRSDQLQAGSRNRPGLDIPLLASGAAVGAASACVCGAREEEMRGRSRICPARQRTPADGTYLRMMAASAVETVSVVEWFTTPAERPACSCAQQLAIFRCRTVFLIGQPERYCSKRSGIWGHHHDRTVASSAITRCYHKDYAD